MFLVLAKKKKVLLLLLAAFSISPYFAFAAAKKDNGPQTWPKDGKKKWGVWTHNDRRGFKRKDPDDIG